MEAARSVREKHVTIVGIIPLALHTALHAQAPVVPPPPHYGTWGVDLTAMDRTTKPGDDFDHYVKGVDT